MTLLRALLIGVLALTITADASAAKAKKKKNKGSLEGIVTAVEPGKDDQKDSGTITVKVLAGKKKKAAPTGNEPEKKIAITKETKFEKVSGKKGQQSAAAATFSDIQKDGRVAISLKTGSATDTAEKVQIEQSKKKKKKAKAS